MNMQQLRYAQALAACGSFVRAAGQCGVTQPTLSNGIAQLEEELGQKLFARTTRSVRLTTAGQHLLPNIVDILSAKATLIARASALSNPTQGLIRVGVSPVVSVSLVELVLEPFRGDNPDVEIVFREMNLVEMLSALDAGQLDFVLGPMDALSAGAVTFKSSLFREEPLVFVPSNAHKEKYRSMKSVSLTEIADETFVLVPDTCGLTRTTQALFKQRRIALREYSGRALSYAVLQEWAELGIGSAILPLSKISVPLETQILIADQNGPVHIRYLCVWCDPATSAQSHRKFAAFMSDLAPSIAQGIAAQ